jgi:3-phenylpropionate/cinnamic acid dioxygenase small subunit
LSQEPDAGWWRERRDRCEVKDTVLRYATALDQRDWALLGTCFTTDVVADYHVPRGDALRSSSDLVDFLRSGVAHLDATAHYISNVVVSIVGNTATANSYVQAQHIRRGTPGGSKFLVAGIYHDQLRRADDGWRIAHRDAEGIWASGNRIVAFPDTTS